MAVSKSSLEAQQAGSRGRLLLIDDSALSRRVMSLMLEAQGYEVREFENGRDALEVLAQEHFDAVLLDIEMPGLDGYSVLSHIRSNAIGKANIPVIACTGHSSPQHGAELLAFGFDGFLGKPVDMHSLGEAVKRVCPQKIEAAEVSQGLLKRRL